LEDGNDGQRCEKKTEKNLQAQASETSQEDPHPEKETEIEIPRRPQMKSGIGRFGFGCGGMVDLIDPLLQFFADFKEGQFFGSDVHFGSGSGVAALVGLIISDRKIAKSANFDSLPSGQGFGHGAEDRIHNCFRFLLRERI
jgi:hypothetical protein